MCYYIYEEKKDPKLSSRLKVLGPCVSCTCSSIALYTFSKEDCKQRCTFSSIKYKGDDKVQYYVNKNAQSNGDHEVHEKTCSHLPEAENLVYLGNFASCYPAVAEAKKHYPKSDGCFYCCNACHTS